MGDSVGLKSGLSEESSVTIIANMTRRDMETVWLDYEGREVSYGTLPSRSRFIIKTFVGHPFIFYSKGSRLRLKVCVPGQEPSDVLWPQKTPPQVTDRPRCSIAIVIFPVLSLRDICFQVLRDMRVTDEAAKQLPLPTSLITEYHMFRQTS